jgi:branched-chain amino acid transport system substrate-binding protein
MPEQDNSRRWLVKRNLLITIVAAICMTLMFAVAPLYAQQAAPKTIKIGVITDITGAIAATGERFLWGSRKAVDAINKDGGVHVKEFNKKIPIELVEADHVGRVDKAALQGEYVNQQGVVALIATTAFLPSGAGIVQKYSLPCLMTLSNNKAPYEAGYKYLFSIWPKVDDSARTFIALLNSFPKEQRPTTIAIFEGMQDIGVEYAKYGEKEAAASGYKTVRLKYEWLTKDLSSSILEAKKAGADAVFGLMLTPDALLLVKQMKELDFNPKAVFIDQGPTNPHTWATLGKDGDYVYTNMQFAKGEGGWPGAKEFIAMFRVDRPKDKDYFEQAASAYASVQVMADAITRAGSLDRKKIRDTLAATDTTTVVGPVKFRANGTMEIPYVNLVQYQNGEQVAVFPKGRKPIYPAPKWKER